MNSDLNQIMLDVHNNAIKHGWWDSGRNDEQILCLIHSEWSEALEEERAGRPLVWHECLASPSNTPCTQAGCGDYYGGRCALDDMGKKPEGFAVELIDGCIRILDYLGFIANGQPVFKENVGTVDRMCSEDAISDLVGKDTAEASEQDIFSLIRLLHAYTAMACADEGVLPLVRCLVLCFNWIKKHGLDPEQILLDKHEYNKTRPYKHGKKF